MQTSTSPTSPTSSAPLYLNRHLWSDVQPFEVVRVISEKTVEIRQMRSTIDPAWKMESTAGGFCRHVSNQDSQRWIIESDPTAPVLRARLTKSGLWSVRGEARYVANTKPEAFYDFNF